MPKNHTVHRRRWIWVAIAVLAAAVVFLVRTSRTRAQTTVRKGARQGPQATPVGVAAAHLGTVPVYLNGLGSVTGAYTVTVHTRVDGQIMQIFFREGDFVQQGQLLAQIDPRPFQAQLEQAEGQMARDQALLANAHLDLTRYRTLIQQEAIPKQQLDSQVATVGQYEGAVKQDQAAIDTAKLQLDYARITAPISGRIGLRQVDPGNIVHATDANGLIVIAQMQPIAVIFTLPEDYLPEVVHRTRAVTRLPVEAWNRDSTRKLAMGYLYSIDNQVDPQTGTSRLRAMFENRDYSLFPNQFVNIRLLLQTLSNQVIIPVAAVQRGQQGTFVYAVTPDHTVQVRPVTQGITEGNITSIQQGLAPGELVVIDGIDKLQGGSKVVIRSGGAGPRPSTGTPAPSRGPQRRPDQSNSQGRPS